VEESTVEWDVDPALLTLEASSLSRAAKGGEPPPELPLGFCLEVGRRLLLAELQSNEWTLRRVEKVILDRDRSLSRDITVDFCIRPDAPAFRTSDGRRLRLVPLSMPGIRFTQQLDESILLAAIAAHHPEIAATHNCRTWVHRAISGTLDEVLAAYQAFDGKIDLRPETSFLEELRRDELITSTVNRFRTAFTLYVLMDDDSDDRHRRPSHRLLRIAFEEPINWRYQVSSLREEPKGSGEWRYAAGQPGHRLVWRRTLAALGIAPLRLRLQVPGAENAASYHFEMTAPQGVQIVRATLLAGRPNDGVTQDCRPQTVDRVVGHVPTVGLHGLEIPNASLCRVQIDLRPAARGWLMTMLVACLAICAVLTSVAIQWWNHDPGWEWDQITNLVLVLVTTAAGVTALVAQHDSGDVAARFVTGARALGTLATMLPVAVAAVLVYGGLAIEHAAERWTVLALCLASLIPLAVIAVAATASSRSDSRQLMEESPWDMTDHERARKRAVDKPPPTFEECLTKYRFRTPAVGVQSAEAWHEVYAWDDIRQERAVRSLSRSAWPFPLGVCSGLDGGCTLVHGCPAADGPQPQHPARNNTSTSRLIPRQISDDGHRPPRGDG
jgi:hypothetical protein